MNARPAPRNWRPGRHFGRRLTRLPPVPRPVVPLYTLGTAARIERIRLLYLRGDFPAAVIGPSQAAWWASTAGTLALSYDAVRSFHLPDHPERVLAPPASATRHGTGQMTDAAA